MTLLYTFLVIGVIATVHEFGHFLVAKQQNIPVKELSIGMGPKILQKRVKETNFTLRLIPLFAYVHMAGSSPEDEDLEGGFLTARPAAKAKILLAGSGMNVLLALLIFIILFMGVGLPSESSEIGKVLEDSPAQAAGLLAGDEIVRINDQEVDSWQSMTQAINGQGQDEMTVLVLREGTEKSLEIRPAYDESQDRYLMGVEPARQRMSIFSAIYQGILQSLTFIYLMVSGLVAMVTGQMPAEISGPVGIANLIGSASALGFVSLLNLTAVLSLNIAIINMLPLPALDGGKLVLVLLEKIRGKRLSMEKEATINLIGFALLIGIMLLATYKDILRLFGD